MLNELEYLLDRYGRGVILSQILHEAYLNVIWIILLKCVPYQLRLFRCTR